MAKKSKDEDNQPDFEQIYSEYPDSEIVDILKKRKHYQKEAAQQAIHEAIKRGIIHSEQDLLSEEYKVEPLKFTLVPKIEQEKARRKTRRSLARSLAIAGIMPVVWGALKIFWGDILEGLILFILGSLWIYISIQIFKKDSKWLNLLFIIWGAGSIYMVSFFTSQKSLVYMDVIISVIGFGLVLYGILFVRNLKN
jgi:hypothetical protein